MLSVLALHVLLPLTPGRAQTSGTEHLRGGGPGSGTEGEFPSDTLVRLTVQDLTSRFLTFYEAAREERADGERRWELWKQHYNFAAVPPTPAGRDMARRQLDESWTEYPAWMERIRAGAEGLDPEPLHVLQSVARLLELDQPLEVGLVVFVGTREGGAFAATQNGKTYVAIPVEKDSSSRALSLAHEFTHAVHTRVADLAGGWERSIAETVLGEGLAMHVTRLLVPGRGRLEYMHAESAWFQEADANGEAILRGIQPYLETSDSETVERFTIGTGASGLKREAYYVGWRIVDELLDQGYTPAQLARVPAREMPALVDAAIDRLLKGTRAHTDP